MIRQYPRIQDAARRRLEMRSKGQPTYILGVRSNQPVIICLCCGQASVHPTDIAQRFCGSCGVWHEEDQ